MNLPILTETGGGYITPPVETDVPDRRAFLRTALPVGVLCGLGCPRLSAHFLDTPASGQSLQESATQDSGMTYEDVFNFSYRYFIRIAGKMAEELGQDAIVDLMGSAASKLAQEGTPAPDARNDLSAFAEGMRNPGPLYEHALSLEIVEDSEDALEVRINECLWAKTFREADASELGYAIICHPDYAYAEAFNPKLRMIRSKTLMQGDECCNHRWVMVE